MLTTGSFLLADELALEVLLVPAPAFDLTALQSAHTHLVDHDFTLRAGALVAAPWADVSAIQFPTAWHSAGRNIFSTTFSIIWVSCDHLYLVFTTRTGLLQFRSLSARRALSKVTLLLAEMVAAVEFFTAALLA